MPDDRYQTPSKQLHDQLLLVITTSAWQSLEQSQKKNRGTVFSGSPHTEIIRGKMYWAV